MRAQLFSMLLLAATLAMLDMDRAGKRSWIAAWLPMYIVWLNLHAGFVIGPVVLFLHWVEQVVRTRRPQWHLIGVGLGAVPLAAFNPYGINYLRYLVQAITMPRPLIAEWGPLWQDPATLALFLLAALLAGYVLLRSGRGGADRGLRSWRSSRWSRCCTCGMSRSSPWHGRATCRGP